MKLARFTAFALAAVLSVSAAAQTVRPMNPPPGRNWNQTVAVTPSGSHIRGNPDAELKVVEFVSYTCPHCASFEKEGGNALQVGYVAPGKVSIEVRHLIRDPVDIAVALLTNCGDPSRFFGNHTMFLRQQDKWIPKMTNTGPAYQQRWTTGEFATRMRAIASDFGFYPMMASRGYDRQSVDRCLADEGKARKLAQMTQDALDAGVTGTPSFMLDGALTEIHDWRGLEAAMRERLKAS